MNMQPSTNVMQDVNGKYYKIDQLWLGKRVEVSPQELDDYCYAPQSGIVRDTDGRVINLVELIMKRAEIGPGDLAAIEAKLDLLIDTLFGGAK
ncbi:MAG: hypothetical protein ACRC28_18695 [Clostridium sp.]|uniref:hypothetical protein n=1 Tax=Clostridium sp. TaxID=1506 RepID=UPI003F3F8204